MENETKKCCVCDASSCALSLCPKSFAQHHLNGNPKLETKWALAPKIYKIFGGKPNIYCAYICFDCAH